MQGDVSWISERQIYVQRTTVSSKSLDAAGTNTTVANIFVEKHFKEILPWILILIHIALLPLLSNFTNISLAE